MKPDAALTHLRIRTPGGACGRGIDAVFEEMTPTELHRRLDEGELWQLLDVREPWERNIAAIDGSIHVPMGEIPIRIAELDAGSPVAVVCHSGVRSARVAAFLAGQGFSRVANLSGGIDAWSTNVDASVPRY